MKLENQVCTKEQAQRLHELGVRCESLFRWGLMYDQHEEKEKYFVVEKGWLHTKEESYAAYTVSELVAMIPKEFYVESDSLHYEWILRKSRDDNRFISMHYCWAIDLKLYSYLSENPAESVAQNLIWLIENGYIKPEELEL